MLAPPKCRERDTETRSRHTLPWQGQTEIQLASGERNSLRAETYLTGSLHGLGISVAGSGVHVNFRLGKLALGDVFSVDGQVD